MTVTINLGPSGVKATVSLYDVIKPRDVSDKVDNVPQKLMKNTDQKIFLPVFLSFHRRIPTMSKELLFVINYIFL